MNPSAPPVGSDAPPAYGRTDNDDSPPPYEPPVDSIPTYEDAIKNTSWNDFTYNLRYQYDQPQAIEGYLQEHPQMTLSVLF